jgi:hypothetical protein
VELYLHSLAAPYPVQLVQHQLNLLERYGTFGGGGEQISGLEGFQAAVTRSFGSGRLERG